MCIVTYIIIKTLKYVAFKFFNKLRGDLEILKTWEIETTTSVCECLVHAFVTSRIDYCYWIPMKMHIDDKLLVLVHCELHKGTPVYLALLLHRHMPIYFCMFHVSAWNGTVTGCLSAPARHCGTLYQLHYGI